MKCNLPEEKQEKVSGNFGMSLYDINKSIFKSLPAMSETTMGEHFDRYVVPLLSNTCSHYYMLLCNELKYYTLFHVIDDYPHRSVVYELFDCLKDFCDNVKDISLTEAEDAIEIWFTKDEETYVMYFFDYAGGVIHCGR